MNGHHMMPLNEHDNLMPLTGATILEPCMTGLVLGGGTANVLRTQALFKLLPPLVVCEKRLGVNPSKA